MRGRILGAAAVLWLTGCAQDPLARHNVYWGLGPFDPPTGPLVAVLATASDTPAKQGLLYTSMRDAEVAAVYAGRALVRLDEPGETESALGEVVYAIEPAEAPAWDAKDYGFVPGWASHGYGLRRALNRMAAELAAASDEGPAAAALRQHVPPALRCTENTQDRADRVLTLARELLAEGGEVAPVPTLEQINEIAEALNRGVPAPGESGCGLREVERQLNQVVPAPRTS